MKPACSRSLSILISSAAIFLLFGFTAFAQSSSQKTSPPKTQKLKNPLNDLLDEEQADIDKSDFAAAIVPLQKFIADQPDVAYAHFQLAYAFTALQRTDEAR